jgi:glycerol-3-phosphate dehydrogenase
VTALAAARLVRMHGTEAREVARAGTAELIPGVLSGEIDFAVHKEGAATLEDLLYRRLRTSLYAGDAREAAVLPAAQRMAALLGWDEIRTQTEMRGVRARLEADLAFRDEAPAGVARAAGSK